MWCSRAKGRAGLPEGGGYRNRGTVCHTEGFRCVEGRGGRRGVAVAAAEETGLQDWPPQLRVESQGFQAGVRTGDFRKEGLRQTKESVGAGRLAMKMSEPVTSGRKD